MAAFYTSAAQQLQDLDHQAAKYSTSSAIIGRVFLSLGPPMSVYTTISEPELCAFLSLYNVGELVSYTGISAGIENTNYFVTTTQDTFVLTIFEAHTAYEIPWYLELMHHLSEHGVPGAHPVGDKHQRFLNILAGKPATLVYKLAGQHVQHPNLAQCHAIGAVMAQMHQAGQSYAAETQANTRGLAWIKTTVAHLATQLPPDDLLTLQTELTFQDTPTRANLPQGVIHADLFHDNALMDGDNVSGVIDFYYACHDALLYDLAVTANDWCSQDNDQLAPELVNALLSGYQSIRALTADEKAAWPAMLRTAALRFWVSRLQDQLFPKDGETTHIKDPNTFKRILLNHQQHPLSID